MQQPTEEREQLYRLPYVHFSAQQQTGRWNIIEGIQKLEAIFLVQTFFNEFKRQRNIGSVNIWWHGSTNSEIIMSRLSEPVWWDRLCAWHLARMLLDAKRKAGVHSNATCRRRWQWVRLAGKSPLLQSQATNAPCERGNQNSKWHITPVKQTDQLKRPHSSIS